MAKNSSTERPHQDWNAQADLVPVDLLMSTGHLQGPEGKADDSAAVAAGRGAEGGRSPSPGGSPQAAAAAPHAPRLDRVPTTAIRPAASLLRARREADDLDSLTASIRRNGVAQPLFVRILSNEPRLYELFAGYRRWRAALAAKVEYVPVIVFGHVSEAVALELNLLENSSRRDMTVVEEARAFQVLAQQTGRTPQQIASLSGRTVNQVANMLSLAALPEEVRLRLRKGQISFAHGRALVGTSDPASLARRVVAERLTVRETELLAAQMLPTPSSTVSPGDASEGRSDEPSSGDQDSTTTLEGATDLGLLQAALRAAIGAELDVRTDRNDTALLITGQSAQAVASIVSVLRDAMRLLRINTMIHATSEGIPRA